MPPPKNTMKSKKGANILIIAGEVSGDKLAASILKSWKKLNPDLVFWGLGGEEMTAHGVETLATTEELATIGLWEAAKNYRRLKKIAVRIVGEAAKRGTKHAILVDYPGFNLKLSEMLQEEGVKCYQIVSPTIWAWHYSRIHKIKKYIDSVYCLFQFETAIYEKEEVESYFIGHPIVAKVKEAKKAFKREVNEILKTHEGRLKVGLLPGSRFSEIKNHMPVLLDSAARFQEKYPNAHFFIPAATADIGRLLESMEIPSYITIIPQGTHLALQVCDTAICCSGTATLECALFGVPFALIYRTSFLTYHLAKRMIRLPYVGIVNIIRGKFVTKEFIQGDIDVEAIVAELENILFDHEYRAQMEAEFKETLKGLGAGDAGDAAARLLNKKI